MLTRRSMVISCLMTLALLSSSAIAQSLDSEEEQGSKGIRTLKDIRGEGVVRQKWDISCGAAALSTVLTYDFKDDTPESAIVVWILHRVSPVKVKTRGGFSLLDLKRFAQARGYTAEGFSGMTIEDLAIQKSWVIVPIKLKGFNHFIVIKEVREGRVVVADPAFGNLTMKIDRFKQLWNDGIIFVLHPPDELMITQQEVTVASKMLPDETIISRSISVTTPINPLY
jgi:uncharacterized protein